MLCLISCFLGFLVSCLVALFSYSIAYSSSLVHFSCLTCIFSASVYFCGVVEFLVYFYSIQPCVVGYCGACGFLHTQLMFTLFYGCVALPDTTRVRSSAASDVYKGPTVTSTDTSTDTPNAGKHVLLDQLCTFHS